jgi:cardiolipin synthase
MVTLPNFITTCRIALTPFVVLAILAGNCRRALVLCAVAGCSDGLDGFLARSFNWKSRLGAYLDPIADKLLLTSVYVSLAVASMVPWWLVWLVIGRDAFILAMVVSAFAFTRYRDFPPSIAGKISTAIQIVAALSVLAICGRAPDILIWPVAAVTTWSGIDYGVRGASMLRRKTLPGTDSFS